MKSIEALARIFRFFGWLGVGLAVLTLVAFPFSTLQLASSVQRLLSGAMFLFLANGLTKKEKWAWYSSLVITILVAVAVLLEIVIFEFQVAFLLEFGFLGLSLVLLFKGRDIFIIEPKETFSQWLNKKSFVIVLISALGTYLIQVLVIIKTLNRF